jgi:hypothetical protein
MFAFSSCFAMILMYIVSGELLNFDGTAKFTSKKMHLIIEITHIFLSVSISNYFHFLWHIFERGEEGTKPGE